MEREKMKLPTKPISSPGRAEKYPPPLMRFLRSNVGSRSRGRSRSSPMFLRKRNAAASTARPAIETQEPSSPKVTCMGQVRVTRSKTRPGKSKRRCKWIRNVLFHRNCLAGRLKPKCFRPDWRKWVTFFHCGFKRGSKIREDSLKIEPKFSDRNEDLDDEIEEHDERKSAMAAAKDYFSTAVSPPKNALLLTRSRSAPYRSSSLACRFWESTEEDGTELKNTKEDKILSMPEREILCEELKLDAESEEIEGHISSISEKNLNPSKIEEELRSREFESTKSNRLVHPLILTRCKSEPARIGEKLDPELSFLNKRRLGFT